MDCSVVIPCHNGADLTRLCLASLLAQRGRHRLEILIVDNGSTDDTPALDGLDPRIRVLRQEQNRGFAGGVNCGLRASQHEFVLVLNNDTQAASNLLDELHRAIESDERIGAVAPLSNFVKGPALLPIQQETRHAAVREQIALALQEAPHPLQDVDFLAGLALLVRRRVLEEIGGFDERFGHGNFEDDDLCVRLRLHGYRLVLARRAFLHHEGHATFRELGIDIQTSLQERFAQFRAKWHEEAAGRAILADMLGLPALAANEASGARERWPRWADPTLYEGRHRLRVGEPARAAAALRTFLAHSPYHPEAAIDLAFALLATDDLAGAQQHLRWVGDNVHLTPDLQRALAERVGEHLYAKRNWAAAEASFRQAADLATDQGRVHNWIGLCLLEQGRLATAERSFQLAAGLDFPLAHTNLGICALQRGDPEAAEFHFATAHERLPDDPVAGANLDSMRRLRPQPCG